MINRQIVPRFNKIRKIDFLKPEKFQLSNGLPAFAFFADNNKVVRVDFVFNAGIWYQPNVLVAGFTNALLREGSRNMTSVEIAEKLDFYGAHLSLYTERDKATVTLYCLQKHYKEIVGMLADMIKYPTFPEHELKILANKRKEKFSIDSEKVKVLAHRKFQEVLFSAQHPYGRLANLENFDQVQREQLSSFHEKAYTAANCKLILSGNINDEIRQLTDDNFGGTDWIGTPLLKENNIALKQLNGNYFHVQRKDSLQSAIRVGKILFNKTHPDFIEMRLLNTLLGGYFGSRLMANIREEKGYTYGIQSSMISLQNAGFFAITTEVGSQFVEPTLTEIFKELDTLRNVPADQDELERVKSYFMGDTIRHFDGPFATADSFRSVIDHELDYDYYEQVIEKIQAATPERLQALAHTYLDFESMKVVVAG
jgi:predicted Zn-dependent peptidase